MCKVSLKSGLWPGKFPDMSPFQQVFELGVQQGLETPLSSQLPPRPVPALQACFHTLVQSNQLPKSYVIEGNLYGTGLLPLLTKHQLKPL